jgi:hypothetical protein
MPCGLPVCGVDREVQTLCRRSSAIPANKRYVTLHKQPKCIELVAVVLSAVAEQRLTVDVLELVRVLTRQRDVVRKEHETGVGTLFLNYG